MPCSLCIPKPKVSSVDITNLKSSSVMRRVWMAILSWATSTCFGPQHARAGSCKKSLTINYKPKRMNSHTQIHAHIIYIYMYICLYVYLLYAEYFCTNCCYNIHPGKILVFQQRACAHTKTIRVKLKLAQEFILLDILLRKLSVQKNIPSKFLMLNTHWSYMVYLNLRLTF